MEKESSSSIPQHIAIIMDGNGRWAKERGLRREDGHRAGAESVRACVEACLEQGVSYLTLYAFSTENWNRPRREVQSLMKLLERFLKEKTPEIIDRNVRLRAIGRLDDLPAGCRRQLDRAMEASASNDGLTLILALSYGGREEIIDAVNGIVQSDREKNFDVIDADLFSQHLYTAPYPDPDLLIRTSGEMRLSNFLLWQLSYTEIVISPKYWPDFRKEELRAAIAQYQGRERRFGGVI